MSQDLIGKRLRIGVNAQAGALVLDAQIAALHDDAANPESVLLGQFTADANAPTYKNVKGRGTVAAPADAADEDRVFDFQAFAYSGGSLFNGANMRAYIDGTFTTGQAPPMRIAWETGVANAAAVAQMALFSNGFLSIGPDQVTRGKTGAGGYLHIGGNSTTQQIIERASADTTSPKILFRKSRGTLAAPADVANGDNLGRIEFDGLSTSNFIPVQVLAYVDGAVTAGQMPPGALVIKTAPANGALTDRLRVYTGGLVHIGPGTPDTTAGRSLHVQSATAGVAGAIIENTVGGATAHGLKVRAGDNSTTGSDFISFFRQDNTKIGDVDQNGASTVAYNTSSDARLKENIRPLTGALATVLSIQPRRFNFKADPNRIDMAGFIAQELHAVYPDAVSVGGGELCDCNAKGAKNEAAAWDGNHVAGCAHVSPWGVDYGKLSPVLAGAIQELAARVAVLEAK